MTDLEHYCLTLSVKRNVKDNQTRMPYVLFIAFVISLSLLNELYDMMCGMAEISDTLSLYIKQYNYEGIVAEYVVGFSYFCDLVSSIL